AVKPGRSSADQSHRVGPDRPDPAPQAYSVAARRRSRASLRRGEYWCNTPDAGLETVAWQTANLGGNRRLVSRQLESGRLAKELTRVLVDDPVDCLPIITPLLHFEGSARHGQRNTDTPITGAVHPNPFRAINVEHINGARGRALGLRIQGHSGPESGL